MLDILRKQAKNLQWILWLIVASFVLLIVVQWGAGGGGGGRGQQAWAAKVGKEVVPEVDFLQSFQRQEDQLRSMLGQSYNRAQMMNPEAVLNALVDRAIMRQEAKDMGLQVAPREIADFIRNVPAFQTSEGAFDPASLQSYLESQRLRPGDFEKGLAQDLLVGKTESIFGAASVVTDGQVREQWRKDNNTASVEYVLVRADELASGVQVSEEAAKARYDADPAKWAGGPGRQVRWALFSNKAFQAKLEKEEDMRSFYEQNKDQYTLGPDQRRASIILAAADENADAATRAAAKAKAEQLVKEAKGGADFAQLARERSDDPRSRETGGDIGAFTRGAYDPSLDEAFFSMKEGEVRGPIATSRGFEVVKLTKGDGTAILPFEEVRDLVSRALYTAQAGDQLQKAVDAFQEAYSKSPDFDAAAAAAGVTASQPTWIGQGEAVAELENSPLAAQQAFELATGQISKPLPLPAGQAILLVTESRDTSPRTWEQAHDDVVAALRMEEAKKQARAAAESILAACQAGKTLDAARGTHALETAADLREGQRMAGTLADAQPLVTAALATANEAFGPVVDVSQGAVVFRVTAKTEKNPDEDAAGLASVRRRLENERRNRLREATLELLRSQRKVERNEQVLEPFRRTTSTTG